MVSGRLETRFVSTFFGQFTISSDLGAAGPFLSLSGPTITGTIGDGTGGGSFDVLAVRTVLRGPSTHNQESLLSLGSILEEAGSVAASSRVVGVTTLTINASVAHPLINRLPDAGELRFVASNFTFNSSLVSNTAESTGPIVIDEGASDVQFIGAAGGSLVLTGQSLARAPGGVMNLNANTTAHLRFVQTPTPGGGPAITDRAIVGWGVGPVSDGADTRQSFLTYDTGVNPGDPSDDPGLRPLVLATEYGTSIAAGGNVRLSGAQSLNANAAVRSLNLIDSSLQLNTAQLTVNSGLIFQGSPAGTSIAGTGMLDLSGYGSVLAFGAGARHSIDVPLQSNTLTKGGDAELVLSQANVIPGGVWISGGKLTSRAAGALGTGEVTIVDGTLRIEAESQKIENLRRPEVRRNYPGQSFSFLPGVGRVSTGPGVTLTVRNVTGNFITLEGEGIVHVPSDGMSVAGLGVAGGELRADGTITNIVTVGGGILSGTGTLRSIMAENASGVVIAPGPGVGRITTDGLTLDIFGGPPLGPTLRLDLNGTLAGEEYDQIRTLGGASIRTMLFDLSVGYNAQIGDVFRIIDNLSTFPISHPFGNLPQGAIINADGYQFRLSYNGGTGNDLTLTVVPEPATVLAVGVIGVALLRRRRDA